MTTFADRKREWIAAFEKAGHVPKRYADEEGMGNGVDVFVTDSGYHNGPGCTKCGYTTCYHCTQADEIPPCRSK